MSFARRGIVQWLGWMVSFVCWAAAEPARTATIQWKPDPGRAGVVRVELSGLSGGEWGQIRSEMDRGVEPDRWFSIRVVPKDPLKGASVPSMGGRYELVPGEGLLRFEPGFPLEPGLRYEAVFRLGESDPIRSTFAVPRASIHPPTRLIQVYPTSEVLPENLLKFYLVFSGSMSRGNIYDYIELRDELGKAVEIPFLEIDEELWDASQTRLTLFIDPGRIKRGVKPLEEVGPSLEAGRRYSLRISSKWRDAQGAPLAESFSKEFRVGPPDRTALNPGTWQIKVPQAGTRDALSVRFGEAVDHALAGRLIGVRGPRGFGIEGSIALEEAESVWTFRPETLWKAGDHVLQVGSILEDLAGNNVGKAFEVDLFEGIERKITQEVVKLPFAVR